MSKVDGLTLEAVSTSKIELLLGADALEKLQDDDFLADWDALYQACPWATVFQSREFVRIWYQVYYQKHPPIIVVEEREGRLTGLLTLARDVQGLGITAAGGWDAYYHTWLTAPNDNEGFIKNALATVRKQFPGQSVMFKYIPPKTPLGWLNSDDHWASRYVIRPFSRPVLDFSAPDVSKMFSKKQFRECRNRLKRMGELRYEQITDYDTFASVFDELADQFDFRKGAMLNKIPFRSSPSKKEFLLTLFREQLLHVTVLKLDDQIIASLVATEGKEGWLHGAGINTHSPFYARLSPGYVIMMMLSQQLHEEGYTAFDLTPGGHAYKERHANTHDQLYELCITSKGNAYTTRFFYDYLKKASMYCLSRAGVNPRRLSVEFGRKLQLHKEKLKLLKENRFKHLFKTFTNNNRTAKGSMKVYRIEKSACIETESIRLEKNNLQHLLQFEGKGAHITRWEFLEDAMRRLENGECSYTLAEGGRLSVCAWIGYAVPNAKGKENASAADEAVLLNSAYCHAGACSKLPSFLKSLASMVLTETDKVYFYAAADSEDQILRSSLENAGFDPA